MNSRLLMFQVMRRWKPVYHEERCDVEIVLLANHVRINNEQKLGIGMTSEMDKEFQAFWRRHRKSPLIGHLITQG